MLYKGLDSVMTIARKNKSGGN